MNLVTKIGACNRRVDNTLPSSDTEMLLLTAHGKGKGPSRSRNGVAAVVFLVVIMRRLGWLFASWTSAEPLKAFSSKNAMLLEVWRQRRLGTGRFVRCQGRLWPLQTHTSPNNTS